MHVREYIAYGLLLLLLLYIVSQTPTTGSGCTRRMMRMVLRHTGSTAIRPLTAGGITGNRIRMSSVFATETTASATDRVTTSTATCAKRPPVSSRHAAVSAVLLEINNAIYFQQVVNEILSVFQRDINSSADVNFRCVPLNL